MNGIRIRTISDIRLILHDYHQLDNSCGPAYLTGITILFGLLDATKPEPDQLVFSEQDHATARAVWSIIAERSLANETTGDVCSLEVSIPQKPEHHPAPIHQVQVTGGGTDPQLATLEMDMALQQPPDDDVIAYVRSIFTSSLHFNTDIPLEEITAFVASIMASDLNPVCPKFWHHAMKDPVHKGNWVKAVYKHLDSCYAVGTFGRPKIPPSNVTVLPAVIVLKMVINAVKQINAHKVRICAHGGHQVQGQDFEESFAHTAGTR
jgi:hypothetical protein